MKTIIPILIVMIIALITLSNCQSLCKKTDLENMGTYLKNMYKEFGGKQANGEQLSTRFASALTQGSTKLGYCDKFVFKLADFSYGNKTIYTTKCMHFIGTTEYNNDPCCNPKLLETQCCKPKPVNVKRRVVTGFKTLFQNQCVNKEKALNLIKTYYKTAQERKGICEKRREEKMSTLKKYQEDIQNCFKKVFQPKGEDCEQDSDCSSKKCNLETRKCEAPTFEINENKTAIIDCVFNALPPNAKAGLKVKYLNKTAEYSETENLKKMIQKISGIVTKDQCINNFNGQVDSKLQTTCINKNVCNDRSVSLSINCVGSFCATKCKNGICFNSGINDQALCGSIGGVCIGGGKQAEKLNKTACESQYFCTDRRACNETTKECDQTKCNTLGFCIGFPFKEPKCIKPYSYDQTYGFPTCPTNSQPSKIGCVDYSIKTESACTSASGQWKAHPLTESECLSYQKCFEKKIRRFTNKNKAVCESCSGKMVPLFKWRSAQWRKRMFIGDFKWTSRAMVKGFKWGKAIDFTKFQLWLRRALDLPYIEAMLDNLRCYFGPRIMALKTLNCDCVEKSTNCWDALKLKAEVAKLRLYSGVSEFIENIDFTIETSNSSVKVSTDNVEITVNKQQYVGQTTQSKRTTTETAKVIGDGIGLDQSVSATLCLNIDQDLDTDKTKTPCFATLSGSTYTCSNLVITSQDQSQLCAVVSDTNTYYPARRDSSKPSSANSIKFSFVLLIIGLVLSSFF